ncbi:hypothetical protein N7650_03850 [Pseudomonas sp. GD04058]|uniref:hypothetical protein n=1 Tax=Pseudomonas sp. GD04058 TaxID=2975429 RepID=UPI00244C4F98|nr:hypothetical protein [Pseudomonas sp. GD04058]MDG9881963.1 hypothetical protein [Pseudomonas sp. GD04058]
MTQPLGGGGEYAWEIAYKKVGNRGVFVAVCDTCYFPLEPVVFPGAASERVLEELRCTLIEETMNRDQDLKQIWQNASP